MLLTVIIPSKTEKFLEQTIRDVLKNSNPEITQIVAVLNGYDVPENEYVHDPRVQYYHLAAQPYATKRHGINDVVNMVDTKYVMALDAHCMVAPGFDEQLIKDHKDNWVQVPRRHRLDAENWCLQDQDGRPPIDYEYIMFAPLLTKGQGLHGFKWDEKTLRKQDVMIDDILTCQGSTWFMTKEWFQKNGFMQTEGYTGWGQEAEEICFTTWKNGGECKVNKNTWYAHLHKGQKYGRMYKLDYNDNRRCYEYSYNLWMNINREFIISLFEKFMPLPNWPADWKSQLFKN